MKPVLLLDQTAYALAEAISQYTEREIIPARTLGEAETAMRTEDIGAIIVEPMVHYAWDGGSESIPAFLKGVRKRDVPVIIHTTVQRSDLREWNLEPGLHYDDYVSKPNDPVENLKASLDTLVG